MRAGILRLVAIRRKKSPGRGAGLVDRQLGSAGRGQMQKSCAGRAGAFETHE
jgi:hypothetical protein